MAPPRRGYHGSRRSLRSAVPAALAAALVLALAAARGASAARCYASLSPADFPHCALLSPSFALHWAVRGGNVTLGMDADTGGGPDAWLAVALSEGGGMIGADQMIVAGGGGDNAYEQGAAPGGGEWRAIDAHSVDFGVPLRDAQQDVTLVGQPLSGPNNTLAVVTRRLRTCDPWDKEVQVGVPQTVSWAYGHGYPSKHTARGNSAVFFVPEAGHLWGASPAPVSTATVPTPPAGAGASTPAPPAAVAELFAASDAAQPATPGGRRAGPAATGGGAAAAAPPEARASRVAAGGGGGGGVSDAVAGSLEPVLAVDVVMPNVTVPSNATTNYLCTHVTLPHDRKYHVVGMRSIVQSPLIHHMVLFACNRKPSPASGVFSCLGIAGGAGCSQSYLLWAPGQVRSLLPPTVGLPMGEPDSTYFTLQVHYNNPNAVAGVVDSSGFQVLYTPQLRQYDAGILTLGQMAIAIPPGQPTVTLPPNVCPSTCTSRLRAPLRLMSSTLHMHTLGRAAATQHIRNGTELPPVGSRRFYDFNFQGQDPVPPASSLLLPGDSLVTTCSYDSTARTNVTTYGESTRDEMCFDTILYYPRDPDFASCSSLDSEGDPGVALCGSVAQVDAVFAALHPTGQLQRQPQGRVDLASLPALAPLFKSGALVRVPPNDTEVKEPYGKQCPDLSYGLPLQEQRMMALRALSDDGP